MAISSTFISRIKLFMLEDDFIYFVHQLGNFFTAADRILQCRHVSPILMTCS
ncbi:MAG: hypothetical protein K2X70_15600 [Candidatus Obscuribacterales bacterium]|nr:hypothetical protein [Candidatus Obscuribacterales bacterium]